MAAAATVDSPGEIRNMIYRLVFDDIDESLASFDGPPSLNQLKPYLDILHSSPLFFREASPIFYQEYLPRRFLSARSNFTYGALASLERFSETVRAHNITIPVMQLKIKASIDWRSWDLAKVMMRYMASQVNGFECPLAKIRSDFDCDEFGLNDYYSAGFVVDYFRNKNEDWECLRIIGPLTTLDWAKFHWSPPDVEESDDDTSECDESEDNGGEDAGENEEAGESQDHSESDGERTEDA